MIMGRSIICELKYVFLVDDMRSTKSGSFPWGIDPDSYYNSIKAISFTYTAF